MLAVVVSGEAVDEAVAELPNPLHLSQTEDAAQREVGLRTLKEKIQGQLQNIVRFSSNKPQLHPSDLRICLVHNLLFFGHTDRPMIPPRIPPTIPGEIPP